MQNDKYIVLSDTREQKTWDFTGQPDCAGQRVASLKTGDYTLEGFEDFFIVEKKRNTKEFAMNIFEPRFERELERLGKFKHSYVVCEFTMKDLESFPIGSGIPLSKWGKLKANPKLLLSKLRYFKEKYAPRWILAGKYAKVVMVKLFNKISRLDKC